MNRAAPSLEHTSTWVSSTLSGTTCVRSLTTTTSSSQSVQPAIMGVTTTGRADAFLAEAQVRPATCGFCPGRRPNHHKHQLTCIFYLLHLCLLPSFTHQVVHARPTPGPYIYSHFF